MLAPRREYWNHPVHAVSAGVNMRAMRISVSMALGFPLRDNRLMATGSPLLLLTPDLTTPNAPADIVLCMTYPPIFWW